MANGFPSALQPLRVFHQGEQDRSPGRGRAATVAALSCSTPARGHASCGNTTATPLCYILFQKKPNLLREIPHRVTDSSPLKYVNGGPRCLAVTYADSLYELKGNSLPWLRYHVTSSEDEQPPYPQNISQFAFRLFRGRRFPAPSDKTRLSFSTAAANLRSH